MESILSIIVVLIILYFLCDENLRFPSISLATAKIILAIRCKYRSFFRLECIYVHFTCIVTYIHIHPFFSLRERIRTYDRMHVFARNRKCECRGYTNNAFVFTFALRQNNHFACTRELRKLENGTLMIERLVILDGASSRGENSYYMPDHEIK